ncbi:MAG TPA: hypothetical protein VFS41_04550 [Edaphobacter sp.]|nr:hypothetical protein [Edaphobacter sp.]
MTDDEMYKVLGIESDPNRAKILAAIPLEKRATYVRLADLAVEINLWQEGLGPKPTDAIICGPREVLRGRR